MRTQADPDLLSEAQKLHVLKVAGASVRALFLPPLPAGHVYLVAALYRAETAQVVIHEPVPRAIETLPDTDAVLSHAAIREAADSWLALGEPVAVVVCGLAFEPPPRGTVWGGTFRLPQKGAPSA